MLTDPGPFSTVEEDAAEGVEYKPWWIEGLYFACLGCGRCCRGEPGAVWISDRNIKEAAVILELDEGHFRGLYVVKRRKRLSLRERPNGECVMYERERGSCRIYSVRPPQCALFPFWPSILISPEEWEKVSLDCPGIGQGRHYSAEEIAVLLSKSPFPDL